MIARVTQALNRKEGEKGFTLVELLVAIVVIGILTGIAVPIFLSQRNKGFDAAVKSDLKNAALTAETNYVDTLTYASTTIFHEGTQAPIASKDTSYRAFVDTDEYVIYGLSKSGKVFELDSRAGGTPEETELTALPTAPEESLTGGGALTSPINWPTGG